jgi:8-oxo-dGTP pyrophosphatase MutT (NUDIX family)
MIALFLFIFTFLFPSEMIARIYHAERSGSGWELPGGTIDRPDTLAALR